MAKPDAGVPVVPVTQTLFITTKLDKVGGKAIALAYDGNSVYYLVSLPSMPAPVWVSESEVEASRV